MAQGVGINETGAAPDASAILDVSSTVQGVLVPRMTTAQRVAIASPAMGLLVYDSDSNGFWFYNGAVWTEISSGEQLWSADGNDVSNTNSGNVGVGTDNPNAKLDVKGSGTDDGVVISVGNSDESHKMMIFGGRENDPNPFIFRKAGDPIRFVSDENGWTEDMRLSSSGQLAVGTDNPDASAKMEVNSVTQGFLPPRMTQGQKNAIANPAAGLIIWCTNCGESGEIQVFNGTEWTNMVGGVASEPDPYPTGYVHCNPSNPTAIVDVTNGTTGKTWMDRNLGANRAALSSTDEEAYGSLYQWGRGSDGHQCVNRYSGDGVTTSGNTSTNATTAVPNVGNAWDGLFIFEVSYPSAWLTYQDNNLWQGLNGTNNPCPTGYRLPTETELNNEYLSWITENAAGAFASPLKLPQAGGRSDYDGSLNFVGMQGYYWSSTVNGIGAIMLVINSSSAVLTNSFLSSGCSIRCIKN